MIMQEFETRRNQTTQKTSVFDNVPVLVSARSRVASQQVISFSSTSSAPQCFDETPIVISNKKPQGPFPYLKRKSIRVDLVLKQQKQQETKKNKAKKTKSSKVSTVETLRKEKKVLQEENSILKGRLMQMEIMFKEMTSFYRNSTSVTKSIRHQECQTEQKQTASSSCQTATTPVGKKQDSNSIVNCSKCGHCLRSKYLKHHERFCGNTKLSNLLNEKDLKRLQIIRMNSKSLDCTNKPKNNWRKTRQNFLNQIKKDKMKQNNCILVYKRNFIRK